MTRIYILTIFLLNVAFSNEEYFLNRYEYGRALYNNPRGVSCKNCHQANGEKRIILIYTKRKKEKKIISKDIKKLSFIKFSKKLNGNSKSIMPTYYLSNDEIFSIYYYLQNKE
jgi:uncharacterized protein YebE (UPF0316 family)